MDAVLAELAQRRGDAAYDTVYLGGGTPSTLRAEALARILEAAAPVDDGWVTLEANPEDVTPGLAREWHGLGVGTLSLGVQSFDDDELAFLGRGHTAAEAERAVETARTAGLEKISIDLIYGLPSRTLSDWRASLERAIALEPDHLSCYQLTIHESTLFDRHRREGREVAANADATAALFFETHERLGEAGYEGYEVSNFARTPEHRSRHNQKYWDHTPYLGVGPGAHSFDGASRSWNPRSFYEWARRIESGEDAVEDRESLSDAQRLLERVLLGLRTRRGIDLGELQELYGVDLLDANRERIERWIEDGRVVLEGRSLRLTLSGLALAESLAASFEIPEAPCPPRSE